MLFAIPSLAHESKLHVAKQNGNLPFGALLVEHAAGAVRAGDESILGKRNAAAAVAAQVGHDRARANVAGVVGGATGSSAGGGGRDLVLFARHVCGVCVSVCFWCVERQRLLMKIGMVGWKRGRNLEGGDGGVAELGGEWGTEGKVNRHDRQV